MREAAAYRDLRHPVEERYLRNVDDQRKRVESMIAGVEVLTRRLAAEEHLPLDLLDRYERAVHDAHVANLLRLSALETDA
jgi:hypothetical protein